MALGLELHLVHIPGCSVNLLAKVAAIPPEGGTIAESFLQLAQQKNTGLIFIKPGVL
jgi:hypothetical protein